MGADALLDRLEREAAKVTEETALAELLGAWRPAVHQRDDEEKKTL